MLDLHHDPVTTLSVSEERLAQIERELRAPLAGALERAGVGAGGVDRTIRRTGAGEIAGGGNRTPVTLDAIEKFGGVCADRFGLDFTGFEPPQCLVYRAGDCYHWHYDAANEPSAEGTVRKLGAIVMLSDPSARSKDPFSQARRDRRPRGPVKLREPRSIDLVARGAPGEILVAGCPVVGRAHS